jgi:hypothetical protein
MSNILSLGFGCVVKYTIDRLIGKKETNFFDWLITDFKTVLTILKDIDNRWFISKDNFSQNGIWGSTNCYIVDNTSIHMRSVHDFQILFQYNEQLYKFILKCNRRLDRIKNYINENKNLHMIHCLDYQYTDNPYIPTQDDVNNFYKYISDINPNNKCFLHIVVPPQFNTINLNHLKSNRTLIYYLNYNDQQSSEWWTNENYNWEIIFDNIKKIDSIVTNDTSVQKQYSSLSQTRLRNIIRRNNSSNYNKHPNVRRYLNQNFNKSIVNRYNIQRNQLFNVNRNTTRRIQYYRLRNRTLKNRSFKNLIYT